MEATPDLSRIVGLIMQNPELIEQISSLAKESSKDKENESLEEKHEQKVDDSPASVSIENVRDDSRQRRRELLSAIKPYLSENRRTAIDSMSSILDILDVMVKK